MKFIEQPPIGCEPIDIGRAYHRIAIATDMVRAMLIGNEYDEIGFRAGFHGCLCHYGSAQIGDAIDLYLDPGTMR